MSNGWICEGVAKDGKQYSNQNPSGPHSPYENFGQDCVLCNLTREQVEGIGRSRNNNVSAIIGAGVGTVALLSLIGVGSWAMLRSCPGNQVKAYGIICQQSNVAEQPFLDPDPDPEPQPGLNSLRQGLYSWEPDRFSWGHQTLFPGIGNPLRDQGIEAFKAGNYQDAADSFKRAVSGDRNDPEVLIFLNNALARRKGEPYTLATVVPVDARSKSAQEMLRGVAQAQHLFNSAGGSNGKLLEIVIANDGNDPKNAARAAQEIVNDDSVLGVIGHNSSGASMAGLDVYEEAGLPMISPTSTSMDLKSDIFFRTVPSDAAAAEKLAQYAKEEMGISNAVIFYNPESSFSNSLKSAFERRFTELGGSSVAADMTDSELDAGIAVSTAAFEQQEAILLFPNTNYTSVAIELAKANSKLPDNQQLKLLGGDSLYSIDTLTAGGDSTEGLVLPVAWFAGASEFQTFSDASEKQWGGPVSWRTAMSFDATQAFIQALSDNATRGTVLDSLSQVNLLSDDTSGQGFQFTTEGERKSEPVLVQVIRGSKNKVPGSEFGFDLLQN